ncbi:hypothetical protein QTO34_013333 [Cnephaeus nilssonii]|uniref:Uncharacterized protein n=1 Tax=Cnephaeus nilssonii TaxID=3371016 RepID=A0AA40I829_CNENI|nr:hypothetical protein QTO34_013333 [Eptesicus nilssonii]
MVHLRGREKDRELETWMREKHRSAASCTPPTRDVPATKMQTYQLYRIFLLTLNIKIRESEGAEDSSVLTRTFITLDKTDVSSRAESMCFGRWHSMNLAQLPTAEAVTAGRAFSQPRSVVTQKPQSYSVMKALLRRLTAKSQPPIKPLASEKASS